MVNVKDFESFHFQVLSEILENSSAIIFSGTLQRERKILAADIMNTRRGFGILVFIDDLIKGVMNNCNRIE